MRFCMRVLCVLALAASGSGCASIYLSSDPQGLEQRTIGTRFMVAPEEGPKEIALSPEGISWKTATAHYPRLVLYWASEEGGEVAFMRTPENMEESFSFGGRSTARYTATEGKQTLVLDNLDYGPYRLQIDDQFVEFYVRPEWQSSVILPTPPMAPAGPPPAFSGGH